MRTVILSVYVLFLGCLFASATRWHWKDLFDADDQQDDGPEMLTTTAPAVDFHNGHDLAFAPYKPVIGDAMPPIGINPLEARQGTGNCTATCGVNPCCNNAAFCCRSGDYACPDNAATWCCLRGYVACPGTPNSCLNANVETCCGDSVCAEGTRCCGRTCCSSSFTCTDSGQCIDPSSSTTTTTTTTTTSSTSSTATTAAPPADTTAPAQDSGTNTIVPFIATANIGDSTTAPAQTPTPTTIVTHGTTLVVTPTPAAQTNAGITTQQAQADGSDAVALVKPWDPRIIYSPNNAWIDTSSSSSTGTTSSSAVGSCHNGTRVSNQVGATIKFPFEGKEIAVLIVDGSKAGDYSIDIDGSNAGTLSGYKDPGTQGDQCLISQPFTSTEMPDAQHTITITIKGSSAGGTGGTQVEFGGFIYRGSHAVGTATGSKNIGAIVGGAVGGVVGGIAIIAIIIILIVLRRRRNQRIDNASAIDQTAAPTRATTTPYSAVPTAEYHDPYASAGLGPQHYPAPAAGTSQQQPRWAQTAQGPFGSTSYVATGAGPSHYGYAQ